MQWDDQEMSSRIVSELEGEMPMRNGIMRSEDTGKMDEEVQNQSRNIEDERISMQSGTGVEGKGMEYESYQDSSENEEKKKVKSERMEMEENQIRETGQVILEGNGEKKKIYLLTIIGEIEGHENLPNHNKTTKYEHILPKLASIEDSEEIEGVLLLINTVGGDVSAGLALAEMVSSLSKPTVSLVIGDSHSIGVPLTVATDYSFIVPSATMIIHPVRMNGTIIGARQTYDYFQIIQDRIVDFIARHSGTKKERLEEMMMNTKMLSKDLGTILVGEDAVREGLVSEVGGMKEALKKLYELMG